MLRGLPSALGSLPEPVRGCYLLDERGGSKPRGHGQGLALTACTGAPWRTTEHPHGSRDSNGQLSAAGGRLRHR
jgi:hypothetical protein